MTREPGRTFLVGLLGGMSVLHLVLQRGFEVLVPRWLPGSRRAWNMGSAAAEFASAALLANPQTRRAGGYAAFGTLSVIWVANLDHARIGRIPGMHGMFGDRRAALIRAPL